jgi:protein-tyrosine phosphatase
MGGILHVCTGNQVRSPMAERLMVASLWRRYGPVADSIYVTSAGTEGPPGRPMQPLAIAELKRRGVYGDDFISQLLDLQAAERAHLILTATRRHRDRIVALAPSTLERTFTWRELAWLVNGVQPGEVPGRYPAERMAKLARVARRRRGYLQPPAPHLFDVADPMGGTKQDYRVAAAEIEEAVETILDALRDVSTPVTRR